jgi:hypothetical protein
MCILYGINIIQNKTDIVRVNDELSIGTFRSGTLVAKNLAACTERKHVYLT